MTSTALCPNAYLDFKCIGHDCPDSCCIGWRVTLDKPTFHFYKQNQHKLLRQRFAVAVKRDEGSDKRQFGFIKMDQNGRCPFLNGENLCDIQTTLGESALSEVCKTFPRRAAEFAGQVEYSLTLSCPEVARLVLSPREPMQFVEIPPDERFPSSTKAATTESDDTRLLSNDLRALCIAILQSRPLEIDARLILLGLAIEDYERAEPTIDSRYKVLQHYAGMLNALPQLQDEFQAIQPNDALRINLVTTLVTALLPAFGRGQLKQYLLEASQGLAFAEEAPASDAEKIACHINAYRTYYAPFLAQHSHVLENYLVHFVFHTLFPFTGQTPMTQYRELLATYLTASTLLLGQAKYHQGLSEQQAVQTIQAFTRLAGHNSKYRDAVAKVFLEHGASETLQLFPLLVHC